MRHVQRLASVVGCRPRAPPIPSPPRPQGVRPEQVPARPRGRRAPPQHAQAEHRDHGPPHAATRAGLRGPRQHPQGASSPLRAPPWTDGQLLQGEKWQVPVVWAQSPAPAQRTPAAPAWVQWTPAAPARAGSSRSAPSRLREFRWTAGAQPGHLSRTSLTRARSLFTVLLRSLSFLLCNVG